MGPLQQVLLLALCLLVSLPLWGTVVRRRRNISLPSRVKGPDHYTSEPSGVKAPVHKVNDSLDRLGKQSDVPTMQILFFHGFPILQDFSNVHLSTWDNGDGFIWPQAWLMEKFPGAQISFVKYGAALRNPTACNMNNIAENLISDLLEANIGQVSDCPVVMVGHCVGGLVIKALCRKAHEELHSSDTLMNDRAKKLKAFLERVSGIFYYSTPHHGFRNIPEELRSRDNALFTYLQVLSIDTAVLNANFSKLRKRYRKWKIKGVGEGLPAKLGVFQNALVVPEASARDEEMAVFNVLQEEDHFSVCKPKTDTSGGFYHLTRFLTEVGEEEVKLREEARLENIEIELKARLPPENFQTISKAVVGIQIPLQAVIEELKAVSTLGLTGMGGSGKTTLAKAVFNELGCNFEYTCFVPDVKLINGTVETVKEEVWKHVYCNGSKVGREMRWSLLRGKRLLLVLDDIADDRDTTALSEIAEGGPSVESRFIATSRSDDLFEFFYKVPRLDETNHDTELFMSYAFPNNETPSPQLRSLKEEIVKKCEGLPLTLEVLGQYLRKTRDAEVWKDTLTVLDRAELVMSINKRLWAKLRPSIDGLEEKEKQMFLDASTFFYNSSWTLRDAKAAWKAAYGASEGFWKTLVDRSLVYDVDDNVGIEVHEQLRSLGRKIADESKAYIHIKTLEDLELLQSANELEKKNIRTLRVNVRRPNRKENRRRQSTMDEGDLEQISFEDGKVHIANLILQELQELRYLDVDSNGHIDRTAETILFPKRLVLLRCVGLNTLSLAHQRRLAVLTISGVKSLPSAIGELSALRIFTLCNCANLHTLPNSFGDLSTLERLLFDNCAIKTLPESFGKLSALNYLLFKTCRSLESLPKSFGHLGALVDLKFDRCYGLEYLPNTFGHLSALNRLNFGRCGGLQSLPKSFGKLSALKYLWFYQCGRLKSLPESFGLLGALVDLNFHGCRKLESLPNTFGHLPSLSRLVFEECFVLESLPESLANLPGLRRLKLSRCDVLHHLPESLGRLAKLEYLEINSLEELKRLPESVADLGSLRHLAINELLSLKRIPDYVQDLPSLCTVELSVLPHVKELPPWLGETGANWSGVSRKVFRRQDRQFSLSRDENDIDLLLKPTKMFNTIHSRAMLKVGTSDYEGAVAELEVSSLGTPEVDGVLLQEKGIIKRMMGDLHGALEDLTAALGCFSNANGRHNSYDSWKHRGYVKFLMEDMEGADNDGTIALKLQFDYCENRYPRYYSLGDECVEYMHFRLETLRAIVQQRESLWESTFDEVMQKVQVGDFQGALASCDVINVLLLREPRRQYFLQRRGVLKRLAGDLGGSLADLSAALEFGGDDYDCLMQRGYVKYLLGDQAGARLDSKRAKKSSLNTCM